MEIFATHLRGPDGGQDSLRRDLSELLRPGRVLVARVLEAAAPGKVLLGIGQHRVLADAPELAVGRQLLLRVGTGGSSPVLDVLSGGPGGESGLLRSLRAVLGEDRPLGRLLHDLAARMRSTDTGAARPLAKALAGHAFRPGAGGEELRALVQRGGLAYESALLSVLRRGPDAADLARLAADLKAELLLELRNAEPGPLREAVARALSALEAEQLLNVARRETGEPLHLTFPVPDAAGEWTTGHLFWREGRDDEDGSARGEPETRWSLGIRFSNTGPIRIDGRSSEQGTSLRVGVEREELAARIRADAPTLCEALASEGRPVDLAVVVAAPEVLDLEGRSTDIRYLREHHVVDVSG